MKLTRELRDQIQEMLRSYDRTRLESRDDFGMRLLELRAIVPILDVEDEPVTYDKAIEAAKGAGWVWFYINGHDHFYRGADHFEMRAKNCVVISTRYAPTDLLDGRLAALDNAKEEA